MSNYNISLIKGNKQLSDKPNSMKVYYADLYKIQSIKADLLSLSEPIFQIGKHRSLEVKTYKMSNKTKLDIIPSVEYGTFLSSDKVTLIYILSKMNAIYKKENVIPTTMSFTLNDFFLETGCTKEEIKNKSGRNRDSVRESFERLASTKLRFITITDKKEKTTERKIISFVNEILSEEKHWRYVKITIDIPEWIQDKFKGIKYDLLTLDSNYFSIKDNCLSRLYEISRRYCGKQEYFKIRYKNLLKKIGLSNKNASRTKNKIIQEAEKLKDFGYMFSMEDEKITIFNLEILEKNNTTKIINEHKENSKNLNINNEPEFDSKGRKIISVAELIEITPVGVSFAKFLSANKDKINVQGKDIFKDPSLFLERGYSSIFSTKETHAPLFNITPISTATKEDNENQPKSKEVDEDTITVVEQALMAAVVDEKSFVKDGIYKKHLSENDLLASLIKRFIDSSSINQNPKMIIKLKDGKDMNITDSKYFNWLYEFYTK